MSPYVVERDYTGLNNYSSRSVTETGRCEWEKWPIFHTVG